ncbi:MAG: tetratricopeptide repeat protein [Bacteroidota bacterium]|nr:tetratricopeptide repeat protein [Bacteroidota bacterium]
MKKILYIFFFCMSLHSTFAQTPNLETILHKLTGEKNDSIRFYLAFSVLTVSETNPVLDMHNAEIILLHGQKYDDKVCQVLGLGCLGYDYRAFGNTAKSLEYNLKANEVAEQSNDDRLKATINLGLATNYLDLADYPKAIAYNAASLENASRVEVNIFTILANMNMGEIYLTINKMDSALIYTQKAYELSMSTGIRDYLGGIYGQLGSIQAKLNNSTLALSYLNLAVEEGYRIDSPKYINIPYTAIAEYYFNANQKDSAIMYSKKAISAVQNTAFATMVIKPSKLLTDIYRNTNIDSAFKYSEMHKMANDSLFNIKSIQQTQLMTFEEDARRQELVVVQAKEEEQRKQNIQYALIAISIITFIIIYLILSRSFIANTKLITFFGAIALLLVFEFLNLLLHPFLGRITQHSPVFMLLALVCIAALLVPLHHRLEDWTTKKLVKKNKSIRLANAKKTIERLEEKVDNI